MPVEERQRREHRVAVLAAAHHATEIGAFLVCDEGYAAGNAGGRACRTAKVEVRRDGRRAGLRVLGPTPNHVTARLIERAPRRRIGRSAAVLRGRATAPPLPVPVFAGNRSLPTERAAVGVEPTEGAAPRVEVERVAALVVGVTWFGCEVAAVALLAQVAVIKILLLCHGAKTAVDSQVDPCALGRLGHRQKGVGGRLLHRLPVDRHHRDRKRLAVRVAGVRPRRTVVAHEL